MSPTGPGSSPTSSPSLRDEFRHQLRDRALDAAGTITLEQGWRQVRLVDVARRARLSRATLHRQFGGKDEMARALVAREVDQVLADVARDLGGARAGDGALHQALTTALRARRDHPLLAAVLDDRHGDALLLSLVNARTGSLVREARVVLGTFLREEHPRLPGSYLTDVTDVVVRATVSHLCTPDVDESAADRLYRLARHLLSTPPSSPGRQEPVRPAP